MLTRGGSEWFHAWFLAAGLKPDVSRGQAASASAINSRASYFTKLIGTVLGDLQQMRALLV